MQTPTNTAILDRIENLPTLPVVAQQIQHLVTNPHSNMTQVADVIKKDQAISARVIRLVNSAFYGFPGRIGSIKQAIIILGLNTVKNIVVGVSVVNNFREASAGGAFNREKFWLHTFACALCSKHLAVHLGRPEPEDYFLAGLLHDIGILVIDQYLHLDFERILKQLAAPESDVMKVEVNELGLSHCDVGDYMACKWKIPDFLRWAIRYHHQPMVSSKEADKYRDFIAIVHVADTKTRNTPSMQFINNFKSAYDEGALKHLHLSEPVLDKIFTAVEAETMDLVKVWGL